MVRALPKRKGKVFENLFPNASPDGKYLNNYDKKSDIIFLIIKN